VLFVWLLHMRLGKVLVELFCDISRSEGEIN
jgi:hypothetical protein